MTQDSLLVQTKRRLRQLGLHARKGLGQHFLVDGSILKIITSAAELSPADIVIEVGAGLGILTEELVREAGRIIAIELDDRLAAALKQTLAQFSNVTIVNEDILRIDPETLLHGVGFQTGENDYKVVANLPYYITSPVLRHFLETKVKPKIMVVMVQKEVARVIAAEPGECSLLSIGVQFYGKPRIVSYVPAMAFYPAPEVDSAVLRIDVYPQPTVAVTDEEGFFKVVRAGFSAPRKQIVNSLAQGLGLPKAEVLSLLGNTAISSRRRAETLTLEEWAQLQQALSQKKEPVC